MALETAGASAAATVPVAMPGVGQVLASLLLVIGLIFALGFVLRRMQNLRAGAPGGVTIAGGVQVGARERVLLIEASGKRLLIGVAPGAVRTLHVFEGETPGGLAAATEPALPSGPVFADRLRALIARASGGA